MRQQGIIERKPQVHFSLKTWRKGIMAFNQKGLFNNQIKERGFCYDNYIKYVFYVALYIF